MRARAAVRSVLKVPLAILALVACVLLLAQFALALPFVRAFVREKVEQLVSEALQAELEIDRIELITLLGHVHVRGARLRDAHGAQVASLQHVAARIDLPALIAGRVRLANVRVQGPWVDLGAPDQPGADRGLLGVIERLEDDEPAAEPPPQDDEALSIAFDGVEIEDGKLLFELQDVLWSARDLQVGGRVAIDDELAFGVARLSAELARDGQRVAVLQEAYGEYGPGGVIELHVDLAQHRARVLADGELGPAGEDGARPLAARVRARQIEARTLAGFGLPADALAAPVDLELQARGSTSALRAELQLRTPGGELAVEGAYDEARGARARVRTDRLEPARFLRADVAPLALDLQLSARPAPKLPAAAVRAVIASGSYDGMPLPRTTVQARVDPERGVTLDELVAQYEHGRLTARGRLRASGAMWVKAELYSAALSELPPVRAYAPALSGRVDATFEVERAARGPTAIQAGVELREAAFEDVQAQALQLEGRAVASGLNDARVELQIAASSLSLGDQDLGYAEAELRGGPDRYRVRATLGARGKLAAVVDRKGPEAFSSRGRGRFELGQGARVRARWDEIGYARGELRLRAVDVDYCGAHARLDGTFDPDGRAALRARVRSANLAPATARLLDRPIAGALTLDAALQGSMRRPRVSVRARYREGELIGLRGVAIDLDAEADLQRRALTLQAHARAQGASVELDWQSELARGKPSLALLQRGRHELSVRMDGVPLHELPAWPAEKTVPERLRVSGVLRAQGELERFTADLDLRSRLRFRGDPTPVFGRISGRYADSELALQVHARDAHGPLIRSSMRTELQARGFGGLIDEPLDLIEKRAWQASLWLGSRRVQDLPAVRALDVHPALLPALVAGELEIEHTPGREPEAELRMTAAWDPPGEHAAQARCGQSRPIELALTADMRGGELKTRVTGALGDDPVLELETASQAPIDEWFAPGPPAQVRPVSMAASISSVQLRDVPIVCESAFGWVSAKLAMARAGSEQVKARVDVVARDVHIGNAPAFHGRLSASADRDALAVWASIRGNYTGRAAVRGRVPIDAGGRAPTLDLDAPASLQIALEQLDARTLFAAVPNVRATRGKLNGQLALESPLNAPQVRGALTVRDGAITLPTLGQRFDDIDGELLLTGNTVHLQKLALRDRDGRAEVSGAFTLHDLTAFETRLTAKASDFPVRRSGVMLARLDGTVGLHAEVRPGVTEAELSLRDARVELTGESLSGVQSLQENPDIVLVDALGDRIEQAQEEKQPSDTVTVIRIDAAQPFWIRRSDFSVLARADLRLEMREEVPSVSGQVEIERGVVELLGQMFDIEQGRIEFMGGHDARPHLDLTAGRKVPGGPEVKFHAQGELDDPELQFLVDGEPVTAGEALRAATGTGVGQGGDASARQQVGAFATGLATGVLTLGARTELGEWVPVLAVENEAGATRLRAGVEAGRLIPGFLRRVVVDAYLEGSLSSAPDAADVRGDGTTGDAPQASVLLELRHPHDLVTEAQYGPGQQWSLDLLWEP